MSKPKPPADLWERMDAICSEHGFVEPPEGSFTLHQFCARRGVTPKVARRQLEKLCKIGAVKDLGVYNRNKYFQLAN